MILTAPKRFAAVLTVVIVGIMLSMPRPTPAASLGDCSAEGGLVGRTDIVFCEPWERADWWTQPGYVRDGSKTTPLTVLPDDVALTSIVSTGCVSGRCLKIQMPQGATGSLALHYNLDVAVPALNPQRLFFRYYLKLGPTWNPYDSTMVPGGKFPGLADVRTNVDPSLQCGNGGEPGDGINCWSMRAAFSDCWYTANGPHNACQDAGVPTAAMRYFSYLYWPDQEGPGSGSSGPWDQYPFAGPNTGYRVCATDPTQIDCGLGTGGMFLTDRWYRIEMFVQMNTPGITNGIIRGWIDGVLSFEKTNVKFRKVGHDNLHVRLVWLDVYKGGVIGSLSSSEIYLDQMVLATDAPIGPWTPGSSTTATVSVSPSTVTRVTATWSGIPAPTVRDWVALYAQGAADTAFVTWVYTSSCTQTPGSAAVAAGACVVGLPATTAPGAYEVRFLPNDGFTHTAVSAPLMVQ